MDETTSIGVESLSVELSMSSQIRSRIVRCEVVTFGFFGISVIFRSCRCRTLRSGAAGWSGGDGSFLCCGFDETFLSRKILCGGVSSVHSPSLSDSEAYDVRVDDEELLEMSLCFLSLASNSRSTESWPRRGTLRLIAP